MYKENIRVIGIDDGPFTFKNRSTVVVGVVVRGKSYVEGVVKSRVRVDGDDATDTLKRIVLKSRFADQIRIIMVDGITLGGFNVVDMDELYSAAGKPVISITRELPDETKVKEALMKYFENWKSMVEVIERHPLIEVKTDYNPIYIKVCGMDEDEAKRVVKSSIIRGCLPEPIRLAHIIASAFVLGESKGNA